MTTLREAAQDAHDACHRLLAEINTGATFWDTQKKARAALGALKAVLAIPDPATTQAPPAPEAKAAESEVGWIVTRKGDPLCSGIVCAAPPAAPSVLEKLIRLDGRIVRRVRITVEPAHVEPK